MTWLIYEIDGEQTVLDSSQKADEDPAEHHPILREDVEAAVKALKVGKTG